MKLYLITRAGLTHGQQTAQLVHGVVEFVHQHREYAEHWRRESNVVVCVEAPNEDALTFAIDYAHAAGIKYAEFREPDMDNALTSVVMEDKGAWICRRFPLIASVSPR